MKKPLALFLGVLMLLPTVGCASPTSQTQLEQEEHNVIAKHELTALADTSESHRKTYASDDAFVRGGSYADRNFSEQRTSTRLLDVKIGSADYVREILLKFNLSDMDLSDMRSVYLYINVKNDIAVSDGGDLYFLAYRVSNDWDGATVTFATAPAYEESNLAGRALAASQGTIQIEVSDAVFDAYDSGEPEISFRVCVSALSESQIQCYAGNADNTDVRPKLIAKTAPAEETYEKKILADDAENDALWAYAQQLYDEWYLRYREILAKGDFDTEVVTVNPDQYNTTVGARASGETSYTMYPTRLVSDLEGYEEKVYDVDAYGGALGGERQEATGYYYTKKIGDRWWIVDPAGNLCHIHGTTHLKYAYTNTSVVETEAAMRVFGSLEKWAIAATRWVVDDLGINAAYVVSPQIHSVEQPIPVMSDMGGVQGYATAKGGVLDNNGGFALFVGGAMPVFDPDFVTHVDGKAKAAAETNKDRNYIFGYFSDNEINVSDTMLTSYLTLDYTNPLCVYSYVCAWTWYCNITGETSPRVEDIAKHSERLGVDLFDLFKGFVYDRYYCVCKTTLEKYDPNRLYMGNRQLVSKGGDKWEWVMRVTGYWCDIMTINYYSEWEIPSTREGIGRPSLEQLGKWLGIPFIVTEFYAKGNDALNPLGQPVDNHGGAGWIVETQTDRGYFYQNFTLKLLQCKECVGWMQFQFIDNDPTDTQASAGATQNSNKGMVNWNHDYEVYRDYTDQIALINKNVYSLIEYFDGADYFE